MSINASAQPELSSLIFSSAATSISHFHRASARTKLTISSRLHSIAHDADFVTSIGTHYAPFPLVANERCGSWYVPPALKGGSVYFKSTDGHAGQWKLSTRRLNLHLFELIARHGGCIIVDSTRKGKSMPDALSKTIPIWIAVLNRLLFGDREEQLLTPAEVVSSSEHAQISAQIDCFVRDLLALGLDFSGLRKTVTKPLRPYWITQTSGVPDVENANVHPVILCTASGRDVSLPDGQLFDYVQGAADDAEAWAHGLTPSLFWGSREALLRCGEDELPDFIASLIAGEDSEARTCAPRLISPTIQVFVGTLKTSFEGFDCVVACCTDKDVETLGAPSRIMHLPCAPGKLGSRTLRQALPKLVPRVDEVLSKEASPRLLLVCPSGKDHSIGVALTLLCLYADDQGRLAHRRAFAAFTKDSIRQKLSWIMVEIPDANPSRATLQSVNAYLLGDRG